MYIPTTYTNTILVSLVWRFLYEDILDTFLYANLYGILYGIRHIKRNKRRPFQLGDIPHIYITASLALQVKERKNTKKGPPWVHEYLLQVRQMILCTVPFWNYSVGGVRLEPRPTLKRHHIIYTLWQQAWSFGRTKCHYLFWAARQVSIYMFE